MKREDFIKIIKLRSIWKIDKRIGNYELPNKKRLSTYVEELVLSQMKIDSLGIRNNGDLCFCCNDDTDNYILMPDFQQNENCSCEDMEKRINELVYEIIK